MNPGRPSSSGLGRSGDSPHLLGHAASSTESVVKYVVHVEQALSSNELQRVRSISKSLSDKTVDTIRAILDSNLEPETRLRLFNDLLEEHPQSEWMDIMYIANVVGSNGTIGPDLVVSRLVEKRAFRSRHELKNALLVINTNIGKCLTSPMNWVVYPATEKSKTKFGEIRKCIINPYAAEFPRALIEDRESGAINPQDTSHGTVYTKGNNQQTVLSRYRNLTDATPNVAKLFDHIVSGVASLDSHTLHELSKMIEKRLMKNQKLLEDFTDLKTKGQEIAVALYNCRPGQEHSSDFELIVARALGHALCPPLKTPRMKLRTLDGHERDIVLEVPAESEGFLKYVKKVCKVWYIVVDAKNYSTPITEQEVMAVSKYLDERGVGTLALLVSRLPPAESAYREQIKQYRTGKAILLLNDEDLIEMMSLKETDYDPVSVIADRYNDLRLRFDN